MGKIYPIFFKSPLTTNCTGLLHLIHTDKCILLVAPTVECKSHSSSRWIPGKRWQKFNSVISTCLAISCTTVRMH
jgi:hypothetical protein